MPPLSAFAVVIQWLGERLLDGTWLAAVAGLASLTLLKRASGRLLSWLWLAVLLGFTVARPFTLHLGLAHVNLAQRAEAVASGSLVSWLLAIYASALVLLLVRLLNAHWRLRRRVDGYAIADHPTQLRVVVIARKLALTRLPEVRVADTETGPFIFGPARPTLVLPRWLCQSAAPLDTALLHELSHLKRRDHCWIWLQRAVTVLYFFWPPVYWVSRRLDAARELACDEQAVCVGGFTAAQYSANLLRIVAAQRASSPLNSAAGVLALGPNARRLEWRISRLLASRPQRRSQLLEHGCLTLLAACCLLTFRPLRAKQPASAATRVADINQQLAPEDSSESANMCLPPAPNAPCVLQGCGTQCAP